MIILDLGKVEMIDSSGIGKILIFQRKLEENGGKLILCNIKSEYINRIFLLIYFDQVIKIWGEDNDEG